LNKLEKLDLSYNNLKKLPEFLNNMNLKEVNFENNENLTGKTLTNKNLDSCKYSTTKLCISDEKMKCIKSSYNDIDPCVIVPSDCENIESYLKEKNIDIYDINLSCQDFEKQLSYLKIDEEAILDEVLDKILSYNTTEEIKINVDGSKKALEKIGKKLPNLKKLTITTNINQLNLKVLKKLKSLNYLKISSNELLYSLKKGSLKYLTGLKQLYFINLNLSQDIVDEFERLVNLEQLALDSCNYPSDLEFDSFEDLQKLKILNIYTYYEGKRPLYKIPSSFYYLTKLKELSITYQKISKISSRISKLKKLQDLDLIGNRITSLPDALNKLEELKYVNFDENPTLTGKTLTNENLRSCVYDSNSSICKTKEMECFLDDSISLC